ncbi:MAG TPA: LacI family DNA-binding transcriptional regulator [Candidatus Dormibacteraeota bacterium]|nr:LacI family DNA-binding transcriptional regulator [Candidatus Dormibacteraeota bacterium]
MTKSAPTLNEVARAAGVSRATASRVFTASPRVSDEARKAVERAARRLGYVPNRAARSLVTGRSDSVALVIPEPTTMLFGDPFFPRLVRGITDLLSSHDLQLVLFAPQSSSDEARLARYLAGGHVDGALLVSLHGNDPLPARLVDRGLPVVVGGRPPGDTAVSYVDVDNQAGAFAAVRHLLDRGRRRVATISGSLDMSVSQDRLIGYRRALEAAGMGWDPALEESGDFSHEGGIHAMRALLGRRPTLDAVFAASDLMAAGALLALREAERRVPEDVAVVGYEDSSIAATTLPPLSSVRQPSEEMGREMARLLVGMIGSQRQVARRVLLATELVARASSGENAPTLAAE